MKRLLILLVAILFAGSAANSIRLAEVAASSQYLAPFRNHPAIAYATKPREDPVSELNRKIQTGQVQLTFDSQSGYLRSVLEALNVPIESQVAVFSKTSLQSSIIGPRNPRTIFFNDSVAVALAHGGSIELAATDPQQGVIFYVLYQQQARKPEFRRTEECLGCHISSATLRVPGLAVGSVFPESDGTPVPGAPTFISDHRSPLEQRWGGWYVTGLSGATRHMGNAVVKNAGKPELMVAEDNLNLQSLRERFDTDPYLSPYSDIAALMVLEHQAHMTNLLTRVGWEVRVALFEKRQFQPLLQNRAKELVDYLLFVDEAALTARIQGTSGFAEKFALLGPRDKKGRSLRDLDLTRRLMRYPCSYMIYSAAFDGLPTEARNEIYQRMWQILSGREKDRKYVRLSFADRQAIVEILRETREGLPKYFLPLPK